MAMHQSTSGATGAGGHLGRLNDLDEFKVADGYPDPRGWDVKTADGQRVGRVDDLIVDTQAMRVRYVSVEVDRSLGQAARDAVTPGDQGGADGTHTLIPIGSVELDDAHDDVLVSGYTSQHVAGLPRYAGGASGAITREYESSVVRGHRGRHGVGGAAAGGAVAAAGAAVAAVAGRAKDAVTGGGHHDAHDYEHDDYNDQRMFARRRQGLTDEQRRLVLAREELAVGKRQASAGEVELRKTVETERVQEQVQLRHDEVSVERRPITDPSAVRDEIRAEEIRVPLTREEAVVQKLVVPREEIIVRKNAVVENQTVAADVRSERLVVDDASARGPGVVPGDANRNTTDRR
jgi:uncharacterized protein (TIGR02271 family)